MTTYRFTASARPRGAIGFNSTTHVVVRADPPAAPVTDPYDHPAVRAAYDSLDHIHAPTMPIEVPDDTALGIRHLNDYRG